jgi:hypothetical protein
LPKQLTTQNATLTTVAVEVKALTISGKQVTLSVFRQLQEEPLVAKDGTLNGVPWGYVNYHPDRCGDEAPHWHIVWQQGAELRRSRVMKEPRWPAVRAVETNHLLNARLLAWALDPDAPADACPIPERYLYADLGPHLAGKFQWVHSPTGITFADEASPVACELAHSEMRVKQLRERAAKTPQHADMLSRQIAPHRGARYQELLAQLRQSVENCGRTLDELLEDVSIVAIAHRAHRDRHRMVRSGLAQLPQLFIAV